jgi:hypothetical protein
MHGWTILAVSQLAFTAAAPPCPPAPEHGRNDFFFIEESDRLVPDLSEGTSTTDVDLVDLDADGDLDLFLSQGTAGPQGRPNRLYLNNGRGVFSDRTSELLPADNNANTVKAAFGDVDADGDVDILLANLGPEQLLLSDGSGRFVFAAANALPPTPPGFDVSADVELVDIDGDDDLDALISNENPFAPGPTQGAQNRLFLNDGTGRFSEAPLPPATDQTAAMLSGDIDGDGDLDIVVVNRGQERILIGDGTGAFVEETAARIPLVDLSIPNVSSARGGGLADLDGDGDLDLLVGNSRGQPVDYFKNDGTGVFVPADFGHVPAPNETINGAVLADVDGDGRLDVYLPNAGQFEGGPGGHGFFGGPDRYFRNLGRKFQERTDKHFDPPNDPSTAAAFGDIDGDGDLDLVVGNTDDNVPGETGAERVFIQRKRHGWLFR